MRRAVVSCLVSSGTGSGIRQQSAAVGNSGDGLGDGIRFRQACGKSMKFQQPFPRRPAFGDSIGVFLTVGEFGGEVVLLLVDLEQLGIAAEHLQGMHALRIGGLRSGRTAAGGFRQREKLLQELRGGFGFFAVLRGDADFLEERLEVEPLLHIERRHIHVKARDAHLVLRERLPAPAGH